MCIFCIELGLQLALLFSLFVFWLNKSSQGSHYHDKHDTGRFIFSTIRIIVTMLIKCGEYDCTYGKLVLVPCGRWMLRNSMKITSLPARQGNVVCTVRLLTHVLHKPTHSFFHSFIATMSYSLQTSFNSLMKDWADKYHVWGYARVGKGNAFKHYSRSICEKKANGVSGFESSSF